MARTKFLAKVASGVAKPDGLLVVPPAGELAFLHLLPVERLWGVGPVTAGQAARPAGSRASARSPGWPSRRSSRLVGRAAGRKLHALAHNRDPRPVKVGVRRRSMGTQHALGRRRRSPEELDAVLVGIVDRIARRLRAAQRVCRTVVLRLRFDDFTRATRSHTLPHATQQTEPILATARALLATAVPTIERQGLTLLGIALTNLEDAADVQLVLRLRAPARDRRGARQRARPLRHDGHHPGGAARARSGSAGAAAARLRLADPSRPGRPSAWPKSATTPSPPKTRARPSVSEQNAEEGPHPDAGPGSAEAGDSRPSPDAPGTSHEEEGDPGQATGNPKAG